MKNSANYGVVLFIDVLIFVRNQGNIRRERIEVSKMASELGYLERMAIAEVARADDDYDDTLETVQELEREILHEIHQESAETRRRFLGGQIEADGYLSAHRNENAVARHFREVVAIWSWMLWREAKERLCRLFRILTRRIGNTAASGGTRATIMDDTLGSGCAGLNAPREEELTMRTSTRAERVPVGRAVTRRSLGAVLGRNLRGEREAPGRSRNVRPTGAHPRTGRCHALTALGAGAYGRPDSDGFGGGDGRSTSGGAGVFEAPYPTGDAGPARPRRRLAGWTRSRINGLVLAVFLSLWGTGCAHMAGLPEYRELEHGPPAAMHRPPRSLPIDQSDPALDPPEPPPEVLGPQPVDVYIRRGLAENRIVQAAHYNVMALRARIPQVTSLDDPVVSNTIYPIPSVAPQYSLMGYNPYNLLLAQQFPWFGTLRLRGLAAEQDAMVALNELCAAQLDVVANVKRAYYDLHFNERSEQILIDSRKLAEDYLDIVKVRYETTSTGLQDVLQAEVVIRDLDREVVRVRQGIAAARADLAQQLHTSPDAELRTLPDAPIAPDAPEQVDRLYRLAVAVRPELQGRLAAIARDERVVELARKRYAPNVTVGLSYMDMTRQNAMSPTAGGSPNVGLFIGFNLPVYRKKLAAGVAEAQARALADAKLYEAERDSAYREVKDLFTQVQAQRSILGFYRSDILPRAEQALETATSGYTNQTVDFPTLITAWREVLQIHLQVAQVESELGKALASLERAVGRQINAHPIAEPATPEAASIPPSPPTSSGAFDQTPADRSSRPRGPQPQGAEGKDPAVSRTPEVDALPPASP